MSASLRWSGLDEFLREFTALPQTLRADGMDILREETVGAAADLVRGYGRKSGELARRVKVEFPSSSVLAGIVVNTAPHSHIYDFGTKLRQNRRGADRGRMPAGRVTADVIPRRRARMNQRLEALLRQHGFDVGGAL